ARRVVGDEAEAERAARRQRLRKIELAFPVLEQRLLLGVPGDDRRLVAAVAAGDVDVKVVDALCSLEVPLGDAQVGACLEEGLVVLGRLGDDVAEAQGRRIREGRPGQGYQGGDEGYGAGHAGPVSDVHAKSQAAEIYSSCGTRATAIGIVRPRSGTG